MATTSDPFDEPVLAAEIIHDAEIVDDDEFIHEEDAESAHEHELEIHRHFLFFQAMPAWVISTLVHAVILLLLGMITLGNPVEIINVLSAVNVLDEGPEMDEFTIEQIDTSIEESEEVTEPVEVEMTDVEVTPIDTPLEVATVEMEMADFATDMAPAALSLQSLSSMSAQPMSSRTADMKKKLLRDYGGTAASEAAVTEALKWFSRHQIPSGPTAGAWTFAHNTVCRNACGNPGEAKFHNQVNAATSLALLPYMGAGQTHLQGDFKQVVWRGLKFLIQNGKPGNQGGIPVIDYRGGGNMYSHGLAAITLCEAYAMTGDPDIAGPAQGAINFIAVSQCRDGGWRYTPRQTSGGDTSVVGWQLMALKSAHMGHLTVPPATIQGSMLFLDKVQSNSGAHYGYDKPSANPRHGTTAVGLLCRMYTGWDKHHPAMIRGVETLAKHGVDKKDIYYDYYAAQVLRHYGGPLWDDFNNVLRDWLVQTQVADGGAKGSWHFPDSHSHRGPREGGRLASTAFATMILEVYYRHMPLYAEAAAEEEFPL